MKVHSHFLIASWLLGLIRRTWSPYWNFVLLISTVWTILRWSEIWLWNRPLSSLNVILIIKLEATNIFIVWWWRLQLLMTTISTTWLFKECELIEIEASLDASLTFLTISFWWKISMICSHLLISKVRQMLMSLGAQQLPSALIRKIVIAASFHMAMQAGWVNTVELRAIQPVILTISFNYGSYSEKLSCTELRRYHLTFSRRLLGACSTVRCTPAFKLECLVKVLVD